MSDQDSEKRFGMNVPNLFVVTVVRWILCGRVLYKARWIDTIGVCAYNDTIKQKEVLRYDSGPCPWAIGE